MHPPGVAIEGQHEQALRALRIAVQIVGLIGEVAVVEIGKVAEDAHPQPSQVIEAGRDGAPLAGADGDLGHGCLREKGKRLYEVGLW
ncbi:hypothetical protein Q427_01135 [Halomonas sp. BC04]|nr:hypothetical protein Q427_01135 [Halomonas sp. BC04]